MLLKSFGNMRCQVDSVNIETGFYFRNHFQVVETMFCIKEFQTHFTMCPSSTTLGLNFNWLVIYMHRQLHQDISVNPLFLSNMTYDTHTNLSLFDNFILVSKPKPFLIEKSRQPVDQGLYTLYCTRQVNIFKIST